MAGNSFGSIFKLTTFGESHGIAIGGVIDGCPAGIKVDLDAVVHKSDYLIVKWDESVFRGGGTHGEVTMAYWLGKPVFLVNLISTVQDYTKQHQCF